MSLVVDASVAIKWYVVEPHRAEARALLRPPPTLIAPDLVVAEVGNALWRRCLQGDVPPEQARAVTALLPKAFARLVPLDELAPRAVEMAIQLRHPIYDCLYLALAEREGTAVVTADRRLLSRVAATAFAPLLRPLVVIP